ncbi:universal stress protein UspE [compost metagenome]
MGAPVAVIADLVDELEVDVVVMGIIQPKGMDKLMGDTTERTLNLSPCSVLTVKPETP